jgi:CDP-diacylglycerol--glycerol-3-phosphate 3-phosphatidyltransferase/cardiolipin synthase
MSGSALLTLPNVISFARLLLAPAFVVATGPEVRVTLICVASFSDFLDGWLARRRGDATRWGALIDPIADRAFVFTAICVYLFEGAISTGQYFTFIARDLATAIGFLVARAVSWLRPVEFKARMSGKVVTVLQLLLLVVVPLVPRFVAPRVIPPLVVAIGIAAAISIVDYTLMLWRARAR